MEDDWGSVQNDFLRKEERKLMKILSVRLL